MSNRKRVGIRMVKTLKDFGVEVKEISEKIHRKSNVPLAIQNMNAAKKIQEMKVKKKDLELKKVNVIKAPDKIGSPEYSVFLAGSIEMGEAIDWQTEIANKCEEADTNKTITLFNPRRDDWDSSWEQTIENDNFRGQVEWELDSMEKADKIVVYFDKDTKSPITLLEVGLHGKSDKMCVCCPEGFYRKGNIDIVCKKYNIPMVDDIDGLVKFILDENNGMR
jgi:hypothetical protein